MPLTKIAAENFTVFEDIKIPFCEGLNVLVGENGVGKTHIMKLAMQHVRLLNMMCLFRRKQQCYFVLISLELDVW